MKIENKKCYCNQKAFFCNNISKGTYIYTCNKPKKLLKGNKFTDLIDNPNPPCDYHEEIKYAIPSIPSIPLEKKEFKVISNHKFNLSAKIDYFILEKLFITFQEIELDCKKMGIPIYNHNKETMYEFCCRVKKICEQK